jgi:hypothetical protein
MHSAAISRFDLVPLAIVIGLSLLFVCLIVRDIAKKRAIKNLPLTDITILRQSETHLPALPGFAAVGESTRSIHPRLTSEACGAGIVVGVFGLIGMGVACGCFYTVRQDARFAKEGQTTIARVQGTDVTAQGKNAHLVYHVRYEFDVRGQKYDGSGDLPNHNSLREAERTQQVSIRYLGSDPRLNRLSEARALPIAIALASPLVLLLPVTIFVFALRRDRELLTKGSLAVGRVIGSTNSGRQYSRLYYYDFADAIGEVRRGSSWVQNYSAKSINVGSAVHVFYLPEDAERNSLLLALFWRI